MTLLTLYDPKQVRSPKKKKKSKSKENKFKRAKKLGIHS